MDLGATKVFIHNPEGGNNTVQQGLEPNEFNINGALPFFTGWVTDCDILCATPCTEQTYDIYFQNVDFGDCNECGLSVAFELNKRRVSNFDIQDYLHLITRLVVAYEPDSVPSGVVTGQDFVDYFVNEFNNIAYDDEHDYFGITAADGGGGVLELTVPCPCKVDIYPEEGSELRPADIVETASGDDAILQRDQLQKEFPLIIGYIPGQGPDDTFTGCEDICVITICGCIPDCPPQNQNLLTRQNAVHLHGVGTPFKYELFVNSSAPGYADFIADLNAAIAPCVVPLQVANSAGAGTIAGAAGPVNVDLTVATGIGLIDDPATSEALNNTGELCLTLDNNAGIVIQVTVGPNATITDVVNAINGAFTGAVADAAANDGVFEIQAGTALHNGASGIYDINFAIGACV